MASRPAPRNPARRLSPRARPSLARHAGVDGEAAFGLAAHRAGPRLAVGERLGEGLRIGACPAAMGGAAGQRSEERRVGNEGVQTCRSWWAPYTSKTNQQLNTESKN